MVGLIIVFRVDTVGSAKLIQKHQLRQ